MSCATVSVYIIYVLSYLFIYSYVLFIVTHIQLCSTASTNTCRETTTPIQVGWASCVRYGIDAQLTWSCLCVAAGSARRFSSCTGNISQWRRKVLTCSLGLRLPKQCHGQKTANKIPLETLESTEPTRGWVCLSSPISASWSPGSHMGLVKSIIVQGILTCCRAPYLQKLLSLNWLST
jgi:hypothetical protein